MINWFIGISRGGRYRWGVIFRGNRKITLPDLRFIRRFPEIQLISRFRVDKQPKNVYNLCNQERIKMQIAILSLIIVVVIIIPVLVLIGCPAKVVGMARHN